MPIIYRACTRTLKIMAVPAKVGVLETHTYL